MTPRAGADLEAIHHYIDALSPQNAPTMVSRILDAIDSLKLVPHRTKVKGQGRKARNPVRSIAIWPYIVYFRVLDDESVVRVVCIIHGARRQPKRFGR